MHKRITDEVGGFRTRGGRECPFPSIPASLESAVDSLDRAMTELKSKRIVFSGVSNDRQVRLAFFTDPDGNPLYLSQSNWG